VYFLTMREIVVKTAEGKFGQNVSVGPHTFHADEPREVGGVDGGPEPHEFLLIALGTCTSMTLKLYAVRKGWPLEAVEVTVRGEKRPEGFRIARGIHLVGELSDEQRMRLLDIAEKCPVHKTLTGEIQIESTLAS
jgi:putative redox protein